MIHRSSLIFLVLLLVCLHTFHAINPEYFRRDHQENAPSLTDNIVKQIDDQYADVAMITSDKSQSNDDNPDEDEQLFKRNKYTNFHLSPLWLSRRTRTNRMYGKPLWISRPG